MPDRVCQNLPGALRVLIRCASGLILLLLVGCMGESDGELNVPGDGAAADLRLGPPQALLQSRIELDNLGLQVVVNGTSIDMRQDADGFWRGQAQVPTNARSQIRVEWFELNSPDQTLDGPDCSPLVLLRAERQYTVLQGVTNPEPLRIRNEDFRNTMDCDGDGTSNLAERNQENDPYDSSDPGVPVSEVTLNLEFELPEPMRRLSDDQIQALVMQASVNDVALELTRDGSAAADNVSWLGAALVTKDSEAFVQGSIITSVSDGTQLATFQRSVPVGSGTNANFPAAGDDYDLVIDDDQDGITNLNELISANACSESITAPECDGDGDGFSGTDDNCPADANPGQEDFDNDGLGNVCDATPGIDPASDPDGDGLVGAADNCPDDANPGQEDFDNDGLGNVCDATPGIDPASDPDGDGLVGAADNCPDDANPGQEDFDNDGIGNACDATPGVDPESDSDGDGRIDSEDNCPDLPNRNQLNSDDDEQGNVCDEDDDNDTVPDVFPDNCPLIPNTDQADFDNDGFGNACDPTPGTDPDPDEDGVLNDDPDAPDNCPDDPNADQEDIDGDGEGDACDAVNDLDPDDDGVDLGDDNCPDDPNPMQENSDDDPMGDACDLDDDNDLVLDSVDNCPLDFNPLQTDTDTDGEGDACDDTPGTPPVSPGGIQ